MAAKRYKQKHAVVQAIQFDGTNGPACGLTEQDAGPFSYRWAFEGPAGLQYPFPGEWVCTGDAGEKFVLSNEEFGQRYMAE